MEKSLRYDSLKKEVVFIDQRDLPHKKTDVACSTFDSMREAIAHMKLRGAPLIGVAGAFGLLLWCNENLNEIKSMDMKFFLKKLSDASELMSKTRPTAVNLRWACERVVCEASKMPGESPLEIVKHIEALCRKMDEQDIEICEAIGLHGAAYLEKNHGRNLRVLTHCNAGALATCGYGTALGVIRSLYGSGALKHVLADETRPYLQGARITAFELCEDKIPYFLICDNMAGWLMKKGEVDVVVTGADRIAANGDSANKIGTYSLSVLAHENKIPFYIAAPKSTFDVKIKTGDLIPIEERSEIEVTTIGAVRIAPHGARVKNPAFDVTPAKYIHGIITEAGVIEKPFTSSIKKLFGD